MMKDDANERSECVFAALETGVGLRGVLSLIGQRSAPARVRTIKNPTEQTEQNGDFLA
jgi:hypothetical protein